MATFKKGNNWYIDYYVRGRRLRKRIGPSKKLAEQVLKDVQVKIAKGEYLGVYEERRITLSEFSKDYLKFSETNKSKRSFERDEVSINNHLIPGLDDYLYNITPEKIEKFKTERLVINSPATVNRELACLKHMFTMAIKWKYVQSNPVKEVKLLREPSGRLRYLAVDEISKLLSKCALHLRPIVKTALHTGMRKEEILGLKWESVDLEKRRIVLRKTKNNELRIVPINDSLVDELKNIPQHVSSDYVFSDANGKRYVDISKSFENALKKAGIENFRFHDLRHTFASHLIMNGCSLSAVQHLLGHKTIKMTTRYAHLSQPHLQEAAHVLDTIWTPKEITGNYSEVTI